MDCQAGTDVDRGQPHIFPQLTAHGNPRPAGQVLQPVVHPLDGALDPQPVAPRLRHLRHLRRQTPFAFASAAGGVPASTGPTTSVNAFQPAVPFRRNSRPTAVGR